MFGNTLALQIGSNATVYIIKQAGQKLEFSLGPAESKYYIDPVTGRQMENWTANPNNQTIIYSVAERGNVDYTGTNTLPAQPASTFSANTGNPISIGMCTYVTAQDNAQYGGIPIQASSSVTLPTAPILF